MATSFQSFHACTTALSTSDPAAGPRRPTPLPETPGRSQASLGQSLVGSLLLSPGSWCSQGAVCAFQQSVSPVLCKFWQLYAGVNGDLLQEGYATPRSAAPRASAPVAVHCWPIPPQDMLKHSSVSVTVGSLGPGAYKNLQGINYFRLNHSGYAIRRPTGLLQIWLFLDLL